MKVRCRFVSLVRLDEAARSQVSPYLRQDEIDLREGQDYSVVGIGLRGGHPWFLILRDPQCELPKLYHPGFFEVLDASLPADWTFVGEPNNVGSASFLPKEWSADPSFLERLDEGEPSALAALGAIRARYNA